MSIGVKVTIDDHSEEFLREVAAKIPVAMEECGLVAEGYAKRLCPVDTGNLRNSITHSTDGNTEYIGTNVEYAAYVEFGTVRTKEQPFIKPAVADHVSQYKRIIENVLKD
jgi:HK97 gp10 family phage protein